MTVVSVILWRDFFILINEILIVMSFMGVVTVMMGSVFIVSMAI